MSEQLKWSANEVQAAASALHQYLEPTPLKHSLWLSSLLDCEVWLKLEVVQRSQSFKLRGALHCLLAYARDHYARATGNPGAGYIHDPEVLRQYLPPVVITASGGNHGQGAALACKMLGIKECKVFMPHNSATEKILHFLRVYCGATVEVIGEDFQDSNKHAHAFADSTEGAIYIHPYDNEQVMMGQSSMVVELEKQMDGEGPHPPPPDIVIASIGGGGMMSGLIEGRRSLLHAGGCFKPEIHGVQTEGCSWYQACLDAGELVRKPVTSIAKTLGSSTTTPEIFSRFRKDMQGYFVVNDKETVRSLFEVLEHEKILVEPSAACVFAALKQHKEQFKGRRIVVIVCGCNVSMEDALRWQREMLSDE